MVCKVEPGTSADYCIEEEAEYHLGGREPTGHWYMSAGQFGLVDGVEIDNLIFRQLHAGEDPLTGEQIGKENAEGKRVCGYDAQFGAPKSVSVLWALADAETRAKIESIQERAVRVALDFAQQHAAQIRTGHNGVIIEKVALMGATFQHGESRPTEREDRSHRSDPQLHTHTIVFNLGQGADGKWRALDGRPLMAMQKAMGAQYHAELARLLETELGVLVERHDLAEERHNGEFEIRGVPKDLVEFFSTRRQQIEQAMKAHGLETREAAALADDVALATRQGKTKETREEQLARWTIEAAELGGTWERIRAQTFGWTLSPETVAERAKAYEASLQDLTRRLTEHESVFTQADLYSAIAAAGAGRGQGAVDVTAVEGELLSSGQIVELAKDEKDLPIYSTADMVEIERTIHDLSADQAATYQPAYQEEDRSHVRATNPGISRDFDAPAALPELDAAASAARPAAAEDSLYRLPRGPVGRFHDNRTVLVPREAGIQLDQRESDREDSLRRPDVRAARPSIAPHTLRKSAVDAYITGREAAGEPLTGEQAIGLHWIAQHGGSHAIVEGGAGTGKTKAVLQGAADLYGAAGYTVIGTAAKWTTSLELAKIKVAGRLIRGLATAKLLADYDAGKRAITATTLILVDEAGQMGSRDFHRLMQIARQTGCRIVWTGDRLQQKAVSAGDPLTIMARKLGSHRLKESQRMLATAADVIAYRQKLPPDFAHQRAKTLSAEDRADLVARYGKEVEAAGAVWARQAATDFSEGRAAEALTAFRKHEQLVWADTADQALECAVRDWAAFKAENPDRTAIVSAARHSQIRDLNARMRDHLRSIGQIGEDRATVKAIAANGDKFDLPLAVGDQLRLGAHLKDRDLFNGMQGIVRAIEPGSKLGHPLLTIDMDTPEGVRRIRIETQRLADDAGLVRLAHGYAATNAIIQGATESAAFGQISSRDTANSSYVIASRARHLTMLYVSRDAEDIALKRRLPLADRPGATFTDEDREKNLARALSRQQVKKSVLDYQPRPPAEAVQAATAELRDARVIGATDFNKLEATMQMTKTFMERVIEAADTGEQYLAAREVLDEVYQPGEPDPANAEELIRRVQRAIKTEEQRRVINGPLRAHVVEMRRQEEVRQKQAEGNGQQQKPKPVMAVAGKGARMEAAMRASAYTRLAAVAAVRVDGDRVIADLHSGERIVDHGDRVASEAPTTQAAARAMIQMVVARGWTEVTLTGTRDEKRVLAAEAVNAGIAVRNAEMATEVRTAQERLQRTAGMRPEAGREQTAEAAPRLQSEDRSDLSPAQRLAARFGVAADLVAGVTEVAMTQTAVDVAFADHGFIHQDQAEGATHRGHLTPARAALMAQMMRSEGHLTIHLEGNRHSKETMARAAVNLGLEVENAEMQTFVEAVKAEIAEKQRAAEVADNVAAMRPVQHAAARPQPQAASAAARQTLGAERLRRELAKSGDAAERYQLAEQLAAITTGAEAEAAKIEMSIAAAEARGNTAEITQEITAEAAVAEDEFEMEDE